jgi:hypothetical protein
MRTPPVCVMLELAVPRVLTDHFGTPAALKAYLQAQGMWPAGVMAEKWRQNTATPGWLGELEIGVPLPTRAGGSHGA